MRLAKKKNDREGQGRKGVRKRGNRERRRSERERERGMGLIGYFSLE